MNDIKITVLGSGGWIPTRKRETSSYLLQIDKKLIILDAGSGISRLSEYKNILENYSEVSIILSHYHLDHIIGLSYLPAFIKNKVLNIFAPSKKYYENNASEILSDFTSFPFFSKNIKNFAKVVNLYEYDTQGFFIDELKIGICEQKHTAPSFGITVGKYLHYATDTSVIKRTFEIAKDVDLLLHECWQIKANAKSGHTSIEELLNYSKKIKKMALIHINPTWIDEDFNQLESVIKDTNIVLVKDEMIF
jgi:ribonuclease BN (tRNA processing enzyme)